MATSHIVPLQIQAQAPPDPLDQYQKLVGIQQLGLHQQVIQGQLKAQELDSQEKQIQIAQAQRDQQDSQIVNKAFTDSGGDPQKFQQLLPQYGASYKATQAVQQSIAARQKQMSDATDADFKALKDANGIMGNLANGVLNAPREDQAAQYQLALNEIKRSVPPKYAPQLPPQYPGPDALKSFMIAHGMDEQLIKDEDERRKQALAPSELSKAQSEATVKGAEAKAVTQGGVVPGIPIETQEANAWLAKNPNKTLVDYQRYKATLVPAFNFNLQAQGVQGGGPAATNANGEPQSYDQQIKSMGPKGGVVKAIIEGRQDPPASFAQKSPYWQDVMQKVYSVDPEFNQQRAQLRKAYTVGPQSKEINSINVAMGHIGVLGDSIDALNNGDVKVLNAIGNRLGIEFGSKTGDATAMFKTIVHRVGPELSKAYLGAGGSAGERGADEKDFSEDLAPSILKGNVGITAQLLRSKIGALENQWDQNKAPSMKSFSDQFISPEATKQLNKWNPQTKIPPSGKAVSLAAAKQLPQNAGKSDAEVRADIEAHGHKVTD